MDKRELMSCVEGISVSDERRLLAEIRKLGLPNIDEQTRLSNGMLAEQFAMLYVIGNRRKRQRNMQKSKEKSQRRRELEALGQLTGWDEFDREVDELEQLSAAND